MWTAPVFCADSSSEVGELDVDRELVLDEFNASVCSLEVIAACSCVVCKTLDKAFGFVFNKARNSQITFCS